MGALVRLVAVQLSVLGIVSAAGIQLEGADPAPHNHFAAGPDCGMNFPANGCVGRAGSCPSVGNRVISPSCVSNWVLRHPKRSFRCQSTLPCDERRLSGALILLVAVQLSVLGL